MSDHMDKKLFHLDFFCLFVCWGGGGCWFFLGLFYLFWFFLVSHSSRSSASTRSFDKSCIEKGVFWRILLILLHRESRWKTCAEFSYYNFIFFEHSFYIWLLTGLTGTLATFLFLICLIQGLLILCLLDIFHALFSLPLCF